MIQWFAREAQTIVLFPGVTREYTQEELKYKMGEENFAEFLEEYKDYSDREDNAL